MWSRCLTSLLEYSTKKDVQSWGLYLSIEIFYLQATSALHTSLYCHLEYLLIILIMISIRYCRYFGQPTWFNHSKKAVVVAISVQQSRGSYFKILESRLSPNWTVVKPETSLMPPSSRRPAQPPSYLKSPQTLSSWINIQPSPQPNDVRGGDNSNCVFLDIDCLNDRR